MKERTAFYAGYLRGWLQQQGYTATSVVDDDGNYTPDIIIRADDNDIRVRVIGGSGVSYVDTLNGGDDGA